MTSKSVKPLDGLVVADFTRVLAGPLATMTLANLGATVIKVERTGLGDDTRHWGPPWKGDTAVYFEGVNRSKLGVELDLGDSEDRAIAQKLAKRADILIENFRSGTMDDWGLGYEQVAVTNPGIIYCSVTGFGSGRGADRPGYDFVVEAASGLMSITGEPENEGQKVGVAVVDLLTAKDALVGVLAALAGRTTTGRGSHIEVNLYSSSLSGLVNKVNDYLATGNVPIRIGNRHSSIAPYQTVSCRDGLAVVACGNDGQFSSLVAALGLSNLATDERFTTNGSRVDNRVALIECLESRTRELALEEVDSRLRAAGVPVAKLSTIDEGVALAAELGISPIDTIDGLAQAGTPIWIDGNRPAPSSPAPDLGQHNELVRDWLSRTDDSGANSVPEL